MATATLMSERPPAMVATGSTGFSLALPFNLDLSCPISIPARPSTLAWPFPVAGPSSTIDESLDAYVTRRYYEAIYLGETLAPLSGLLADWQRASHGDQFAAVAGRLIAPLSIVEERHRRTLPPVVAVVLADGKTQAAQTRLEEVVNAAGLGAAERAALEMGVKLRASSRVVVDGKCGVIPRALGQEFEMREVLVQLILLLLYRASPRPASRESSASARPRKRSHKGDVLSPIEDTDGALDRLAGRLSVWLAMSEMSEMGELDGLDSGKGKGKESHAPPTPSTILASLWTLLVTFLPREAKFLSSFHLVVFGKEIAPELLPQKKRRKPELTHRLDNRRSSVREPVETTRETVAMGRSSSRASVTSPPRERRSASILDLDAPAEPKRRQLKARPPMVLKRAHSMAARASNVQKEKEKEKEKEATQAQVQAQSQGGSGLMGRNLSRMLSEAQSQAQGQSQSRELSRTQSQATTSRAISRTQSQVESRTLAPSDTFTFVSATPVKQRANPFARKVHHPTPIREEPSSAERSVRSFVAETPVTNRTARSFVAETPLAPIFVAETPVAKRHGPALVNETPFDPRVYTIAEGGDSDDDLANLMVSTDDEASDDGQGVPETPRR